MSHHTVAMGMAADLLESYVIEDDEPARTEACEIAIKLLRRLIDQAWQERKLGDAEA